mgnify:CR=1 FL=1
MLGGCRTEMESPVKHFVNLCGAAVRWLCAVLAMHGSRTSAQSLSGQAEPKPIDEPPFPAPKKSFSHSSHQLELWALAFNPFNLRPTNS